MLNYMLELQYKYSVTVTGIVTTALLVFVAWLGFSRYPLPKWLRSTLAVVGLAVALIAYVYLLLSGQGRFQ
jgi:multisubunit Na+/H+ antiporter MnhB subunit